MTTWPGDGASFATRRGSSGRRYYDATTSNTIATDQSYTMSGVVIGQPEVGGNESANFSTNERRVTGGGASVATNGLRAIEGGACVATNGRRAVVCGANMATNERRSLVGGAQYEDELTNKRRLKVGGASTSLCNGVRRGGGSTAVMTLEDIQCRKSLLANDEDIDDV